MMSYLNCVLQSLYMTPEFRNALYRYCYVIYCTQNCETVFSIVHCVPQVEI